MATDNPDVHFHMMMMEMVVCCMVCAISSAMHIGFGIKWQLNQFSQLKSKQQSDPSDSLIETDTGGFM